MWFNTEIWDCYAGQIPMGGSGEGSINIRLVRIGQVISIDREHGSRINHIKSAPTTHSMTQVGHTAMFVVVEKDYITITVSVYVNKDTKQPNFSSACCK
jgi:hypothetical protein